MDRPFLTTVLMHGRKSLATGLRCTSILLFDRYSVLNCGSLKYQKTFWHHQ